jgi:L-ascorbate metabolism protein UlaG (beta-lactamase superfamily)
MRFRIVTLGSALSVGLVVLLATCRQAPKMPAADGAVIEIRRSDGAVAKSDSSYEKTLQIYWFGTACHLIQLGNISVLTDPFVTNDFKLAGMKSSPPRVAETLGRIHPPDLILVNHSHHDHVLDAFTAMSQSTWRKQKVPLFGGTSCKNLLAGWRDAEVDARVHAIPDAGGRLSLSPALENGHQIKVTAFRSKHSPHLKCGFTLANGIIKRPRKSVPRSFLNFQAGEVFNFLIELKSPSASFNIFILGAPFDLEKLPDSLSEAGTRIDVAIILAPTADNVPGYPEDHLNRLRPKHVILSHFNTFMREDPDAQLAILGKDNIQMPKLSRDVQSTFVRNAASYPEFEKVYIPAITKIESDGSVRNVIRIR